MTEEEIRRERLAWLRDNRYDGSQVRLAEKLERSASQLAQWLSGHRAISADSARYIEKKTGYPKYWLDGDVAGSAPALSPMAQRLGRAFDEIKSETRQTVAFVAVMEVLEKAATEPVPDADRLVHRPKTRRGAHK